MHDCLNHIYYYNKQIIKLTCAENKLLKLFIENKGRIISKEEIYIKVYNQKYFSNECDNLVRISVSRLRKKCNIDIISRYKLGYMLF